LITFLIDHKIKLTNIYTITLTPRIMGDSKLRIVIIKGKMCYDINNQWLQCHKGNYATAFANCHYNATWQLMLPILNRDYLASLNIEHFPLTDQGKSGCPITCSNT